MRISRIQCEQEICTPIGKGCEATLFLGDSVKVAEKLAQERPSSVQLIYIDPPFNTGQTFRYRPRLVQGAQPLELVAYTDRFEGGLSGYLDMMRAVLTAAHTLLDARGTIYVHVDYRVSAHIRLLLDEVFGADHFVNEIIWQYKSGGRALKHFSRKHDTIFLYSKRKGYRFNAAAAASRRGSERRNHMKKQVDEHGRVFFSIRSNGKLYKYYEDSPVFLSDVWNDIPHLQQRDPERTHYDTQKPRALLERIISVSSSPGDTVADFFCGSGTTLDAAVRLGRKAIGVDASVHAVNVTRQRLVRAEAGFCCYYGSALSHEPSRLRIKAGQDQDGVVRVYLKEFCIRQPDNADFPAPNPVQLTWPDRVDVLEDGELIEDGVDISGRNAADSFALGHSENGVFYARSARVRLRTAPEFPEGLAAVLPDGVDPVLHVTDLYGGHHYFRLEALKD